ncbi:MAG: anti-sigma factor [Mycobacterium sp.]
MTEAEGTQLSSHIDDRSLTLEMSARLDNLAMLRTVVAAAAFDDLNMDAVADLKLATDEACTRLVRSSVPGATLTIRLEFHPDKTVLSAHTHCQSAEVVFPSDSFSWHVLSTLADAAETFERDDPDDPLGRVVGITMTTRRDAAATVRVAHG